MIEVEKKILSSFKKLIVVFVACSSVAFPTRAGIPVIDVGNLTQNMIIAIENVAHTAKQVQQYSTQLDQFRTQLAQYENMIQNTVAPAAYVWDQAQTTMNSLRTTIDSLAFYKRQLGSIDAYLAKFQDVNYYRSSPCFNSGPCDELTLKSLLMNQQLAQSESQKKANDALFKGLDMQQDNMQNDANTLRRLQAGAQGATGQMQALGFANQLASSQANQLLQIRALLIAQQNAVATRNQALADDEAMRAAASERARSGKTTTSEMKRYSF